MWKIEFSHSEEECNDHTVSYVIDRKEFEDAMAEAIKIFTRDFGYHPRNEFTNVWGSEVQKKREGRDER